MDTTYLYHKMIQIVMITDQNEKIYMSKRFDLSHINFACWKTRPLWHKSIINSSISRLFSLTFPRHCFCGLGHGSWILLPLDNDVNGKFLAQIRHFITQFRKVFNSSDNLQLHFSLLTWKINLTAFTSLVRKWHERGYFSFYKGEMLAWLEKSTDDISLYIYLRYSPWKNSTEEVSYRPANYVSRKSSVLSVNQ